MRREWGPAVWWGVAGLSLLGLGLTTYLAVVYMQGHAPACGPASGCAQVTTSRYARFLGIPVTLLGMAMYAALLLGALAMLSLEPPPRPLPLGLLLLSGAGVGFSTYLTVVEVAVLRALCDYCLASFGLVTLIFLLTAGRGRGPSPRTPPAPPPPPRTAGSRGRSPSPPS